VVPAKLFEYMAARRPILAIAPEGEARGLLQGHPATYGCHPADAEAIAGAIGSAVERDSVGNPLSWEGFDPTPFSRTRLAAELALNLRQVVGEWASVRR
jgi:hypothetical protein